MKHMLHRQFIVVSGSVGWCHAEAQRLLPGETVTWISACPPQKIRALRAGQVSKLLGGELDALVFDAHSDFNPDAFGAAAGVLRGGGVFMLLTPPLSQWTLQVAAQAGPPPVHGYAKTDIKPRFIQRLSRLLDTAPGLIRLSEGESRPRLSIAPQGEQAVVENREQAHAVAATVRVAVGHRKRPLVLTADRGRGKSAAFGMAAAQLLRRGKSRILVTAPRISAVEALFRHAAELLPLCHYSRGLIEMEGQRIEFIAPDALQQQLPTADLLLVDEAAGIPAPLLESLLKHYSRIAFATTVHGYEGTGRGFRVRFSRVLDRLTPQWQSLQLQHPVRWAADDPLEAFTFEALLLDAEPADAQDVQQLDSRQIGTQQLPVDELLHDERLLRQLFGLLVIAHYRTSPMDLRHLLEGPNLSVWVSRYQGRVVAACLTAREGQLDEALGREVWLGKRRPQGHLLPQTLITKMGLQEAAALHYQRIVRIAVHPALQRRGLGSQLLGKLVERVAGRDVDIIGSSFGASEELLNFWQQNGFSALRLGMRRESSSGAHSAVLLKPLSDAGHLVCAAARRRFLQQFPVQLAEPLRDLQAGVAIAMLGTTSGETLSAGQRRELMIFADGGRDYADCLADLNVFARQQCVSHKLALADRKLLVSKILQGHDWQEVAAITGLSGRKQVLQRLRQLVRIVLA